MHNDSQQYGITTGITIGLHKNAHGLSLVPQTYVTYIAYCMTVIFLPKYTCTPTRRSICLQCSDQYLKRCKNINLLHTIITITILLFSHISFLHVRHIEPNWTCSWARFTLVANRTLNAFAIHWTGRVKITTVPNRSERNRTGTGQNHALRGYVVHPGFLLLRFKLQ